jgi:hypothetical protein
MGRSADGAATERLSAPGRARHHVGGLAVAANLDLAAAHGSRAKGALDLVRRFVGDLVGAITNEAGVGARAVGAIQIADRYTIVEVADESADEIERALRAGSVRGRKVQVRRDREAAAVIPRPPRRG